MASAVVLVVGVAVVAVAVAVAVAGVVVVVAMAINYQWYGQYYVPGFRGRFQQSTTMELFWWPPAGVNATEPQLNGELPRPF